MNAWIMRGAVVALVLGIAPVMTSVMTSVALAQESTNLVTTTTDWSVFVEDNPKECWGVTIPKETVNTRDGQPVLAKRGDILLFVTYRPGQPGEVSFTGGYPFAGGSTVAMNVDGTTYDAGHVQPARLYRRDGRSLQTLPITRNPPRPRGAGHLQSAWFRFVNLSLIGQAS